MLALCWPICRSWASLFHSGTPLARLLGVFFTHVRFFFRVLGGSGSDVWASRNHFEGPKLLFLVFCRPRRSAMRKNCACAKTTVLPVFLYGFYILRACLQVTKQRKIIPGACSTELPAKIVLPFRLEMDSGGVWRSLGRHLTGFCSLLGGFWPLLGTSWASLGHFLDALGCLLAALWSCTAAFRFPGPSQASILKGLGTSQTEF